ncbi:MAG: LTA synthase family protein, partial [Sphingobacteriales bacterium]
MEAYKKIAHDYPFLHYSNKNDVLSKYFYKADSSPNIVLIITEGLADKFIHPYYGYNFMPFLDSLSKKSLYWDHFFTNGERSFAAVPSLTGSLPYGKSGFTLMDRLPNHFSLVNVLNNNDYYTSFFYGQGAWFHKKDAYFRFNNIDLVFDNSKFSPEYSKIIVGENKFFWGYNDKELFGQSLKVIDTLPPKKRFDIYFTGTMHSPFIISSEKYYNELYDNIIAKNKNDEEKIFLQTYRKYFLSLLFTNDALSQFFDAYRKRPDYKNTIFIVTGDHPMTEIPIENPLKKYHVPFIIFSPLLKQPHTFHSVGSHLDLYESLLSYLHISYGQKIPFVSAAISNLLDTATPYRYTKPIVFMNRNREVIDFLDNGFYLNNNEELYKVDENFGLERIDNEKKFRELSKKLEAFSRASLYASTHGKLVPDSLYYK